MDKYLKEKMPPLMELSSFLKTFEIKYKGYTKRKMTVSKESAPPEHPPMPFRLPLVLVQLALRLVNQNMPVDIPENLCSGEDEPEEWLVVHIDGLGEFSRATLLAMQNLWNMEKPCLSGLKCYSWLTSEAYGLLADQGAEAVAQQLLEANPNSRIPGFAFDLRWSHVYCAQPETWFNDNIIHAFLENLRFKFKRSKTVFLPPLSNPATSKGTRIPERTLTELETAVEDFVFMPINLNKCHWACICVDMRRSAIICNDSVDSGAHRKLLEELASEICSQSLSSFSFRTVNNPLQSDGYNCGLFVCLFFWKRLWDEAGNDYDESGLARRRWQILSAIANFEANSQRVDEDANKQNEDEDADGLDEDEHAKPRK